MDLGHGSNTLMKTDSIEEIAVFAAEKSGEDVLNSLLEDRHGNR